jgi:uncharacterized protein (DUF697 family)
MKCEFCKMWLLIIVMLVAGLYTAYRLVPASELNIVISGAWTDYFKNGGDSPVSVLQPSAGEVDKRDGNTPPEKKKIDGLSSSRDRDIPLQTPVAESLSRLVSWLVQIVPMLKLEQFKAVLIALPIALLLLIMSGQAFYRRRIRSQTYRGYRALLQANRQMDSLDLAVIDREIAGLTLLHGKLDRQVSVPLAHMPDFHSLCIHVDGTLNRLKEKREILLGEPAALPSFQEMPAFFMAEPAGDKDLDALAEQEQPLDNPEPAADTEESVDAQEALSQGGDSEQPQSQLLSGQPEPDTATETPEDELPPANPSPGPLLETVKDTGRIGALDDSKYNQYRQAERIVGKHMLAGMALSALPVPILDVAALTATQLNLLDNLSTHYGVEFNKERGKAMLAALFGGSLPTILLMGLSSLVKTIPGIGTVAGGAGLSVTAGAVIYATGRVFIGHFEAGGELKDFDGRQHREHFQQALKDGPVINMQESREQGV